jgi:hypothetical protein
MCESVGEEVSHEKPMMKNGGLIGEVLVLKIREF